MYLDHIDLPAPVQAYLRRLVSSDRLAHLWIFFSPSTERATAIAKAFLLDWLGAKGQSTHPDLHEVQASGKVGLHSIDSIRHLVEELSLAPFAEKGRAVVIDSADRMAPATANALLKTLEEPPPRTVIILTTSSLNRILPTIVSRAQVVRFPAPHFSIDADVLEPLLSLCRRTSKASYSELYKACEAIANTVEKEEASLSKKLLSSENEGAQEVDGGITIWRQIRSKRILEDAYIALRDRQSIDPKLLLQAMEGIDCGADLMTMLLWFLSTVL